MAHRVPAPGDLVAGRGDWQGESGEVLTSEPPCASDHRCRVRWSDGGEEVVDSRFLTITADGPAAAVARLESLFPEIPWRTPAKVTLLGPGASGVACRLCIALHGLRGDEADRLFETEDGWRAHMEEAHPA